MAFAISSRLAQIGSSGGNSGRGASARRCSISAGEDAISGRGVRPCRALPRLLRLGLTSEGLAGNVDAEPLVSALPHGKARAVDRDAVADFEAAQAERAGVDREAQSTLRRLDPADFSDGGYDSGKHGKE